MASLLMTKIHRTDSVEKPNRGRDETSLHILYEWSIYIYICIKTYRIYIYISIYIYIYIYIYIHIYIYILII